MKKNRFVIYGISAVVSVIVMNGCNLSHTNINPDNNNSKPPLTEPAAFTGSAVSFVLENLAAGMLKTVGGNVMGNLLVLLGWGDSGNIQQQKTLDSIEKKIGGIQSEIHSLEKGITALMKQINFTDYNIKESVNWPRQPITDIFSVSRDLMQKAENKKPGDGNRTEIKNFANTILDPTNGIRPDVDGIFLAIKGNNVGILSNHVKLMLTKLSYNDPNLKVAYKSLEHFTSTLLNAQLAGVNLVIEAYKAQDNNSSAKIYFNDFVKSNDNGDGVEAELYDEVANLDNSYSFIYNAVNLVLENAPLYGQFLSDSAVSILKQAEFYRLISANTDHSKFGLHLFHISTMDMKKAPDILYVAMNKTGDYACKSSTHTVTGRTYDYWKDGNVKPSREYNVVEYDCGTVPNGNYDIFVSEKLDAPSIGRVEVEQYDTNYDLNKSGNISYGFALLTDRVDNRYEQSSDKWTTYKPKKDNYNSYTKGGANNWPIVAKAIHSQDEKSVDTESKARMELQGHFKFTGKQNPDAPIKMSVKYHAGFYMEAYAPFSSAEGGGNAWSEVKIGIWDESSSKFAVHEKSKILHADTDHPHETLNPYDSSGALTFTPETGHDYYIYFNMYSEQCCNDDYFAMTNLNTVFHVYTEFSQ